MTLRSINHLTQNFRTQPSVPAFNSVSGVKIKPTLPSFFYGILQKKNSPVFQERTYSTLKNSKPFARDLILRRQLFSSPPKVLFSPEEYQLLSDPGKFAVNILLGMQFIWKKIQPQSPIPNRIDRESWFNFVNLIKFLKKHDERFANLDSFIEKEPADWDWGPNPEQTTEAEGVLDNIAIHIFFLSPFPFFHPEKYRDAKILYADLNDKKWGMDALTGLAHLNYERLDPDQKAICDLSVNEIRPGETLCDLCCWNGNSLLIAALKAMEMKKEIDLMGINLTPRGLVKSLLTAKAIGLDDRLTLGFGNVIYPLVLPKAPRVIMNSRLLSILTGERAQIFLKENLNQLLEPEGSVAFLSASLMEGKAFEEIDKEFEGKQALPSEKKRINKTKACIQTKDKQTHEIGVIFLRKYDEYANQFTLHQTYYTVEGLKQLMLDANLEIEEIKYVITAERQHRVILKVKLLRPKNQILETKG